MKMIPYSIPIALLALAALSPCRAQEKTNDLHQNFCVKLPGRERPFPEPLAPGEQPGFKLRGTKGWGWTPEQYLSEIPWLARFKMNFLMNCYGSMFMHEPTANGGFRAANRWWKTSRPRKRRPTRRWFVSARNKASSSASA